MRISNSFIHSSNPNLSFKYGGTAEAGKIEQKFYIVFGENGPTNFYMPRNPVFEMEYATQSGIYPYEIRTPKVLINWSLKRYSYFDPDSSTRKEHPMLQCSGNIWGVRLPRYLSYPPVWDTSPPTDSSCGIDADAPNKLNLTITDLGEGFY
jgi:hypothetical protein